jgi:GT2 family glycosyltransferase
MYRAPIFIMSFDRPGYLAEVLDSLLTQEGCDIDGRAIYLFQDGGTNRFSGEIYATEDGIEDCIACFTSRFPQGTVCRSPDNIGIALNFERAERFGFENLAAPAVIFLEDDLVLSPQYIRIIDLLIDRYRDDERVGYVSAYGPHLNDLARQRRRQTWLVAMRANWAFGLFRRHWLAMRPRFKQYLALVETCDYRLRPAEAIFDLYESWGFGRQVSSQDRAKALICCLLDSACISTFVCNARYIGQNGLHMTTDMFERQRYSDTMVFPDPVLELESLSDASYRQILLHQRRGKGLARHGRRRGPILRLGGFALYWTRRRYGRLAERALSLSLALLQRLHRWRHS